MATKGLAGWGQSGAQESFPWIMGRAKPTREAESNRCESNNVSACASGMRVRACVLVGGYGMKFGTRRLPQPFHQSCSFETSAKGFSDEGWAWCLVSSTAQHGNDTNVHQLPRITFNWASSHAFLRIRIVIENQSSRGFSGPYSEFRTVDDSWRTGSGQFRGSSFRNKLSQVALRTAA
jgi:hypothetical protein